MAKRKAAKKRTLRTPNGRTSKIAFKRAMHGTHGSITRMAERIECSRETVRNAFKKPGWEEIAELWEQEKNRIATIAEDTLERNMSEEADQSVASANARWILGRLNKRYREQTNLNIGGGDTPIEVQSWGINPEDLSTELQRAVLREIREKKATEQGE